MNQNNTKELLELAETISSFGTWELDVNTHQMVWSDGVFRMCGYEPKEFEIDLEKALSIVHPEDRCLAIATMNEAIEKDAPYEIRKRFITKHKKIIHILSKGKLIKDEKGKPTRLFGVFQDITKSVQLEEALRETIDKLKSRNSFIETIIEHLPIGIAVNKISTGEITMSNHSFSSIYGCSREDLKDFETFSKIIFRDETYRNKITQRVYTDIQSGDPSKMQWDNIEVTTVQNEKRIINAKNIPLFDQDLMISTVIDQTENINSDKKYRYLFQNNPAIMLVFDIKTFEVVDCNEVALEKYGYSRDEFLSLTIKDIRPAEDIPLINTLLSDEEPYLKPLENTGRHQKKNGDIFNVSISGRILDYEGRKCSLVQITATTEKLLIEKSLKESEEKYKRLFEDNPGPMIIWDFETKNIVDCNIEALHLYGYSREEFLKLSILDIRPEEDIYLLKNIIKKDRTYGSIQKNTLRHKKRNGDLFYVDITGHLISYNGRKCSLAMLNDVTKQKEYELTIEENNLRFEYVTNATSDAIWDWDLNTQDIYWGKGFYQLFGYREGLIENKIDFWAKNIHPADLTKVQESLNQMINSDGTKWSDEYRFKKANGDYAYVADRGFVIRDKNGKASRMVGAVRDITQKKVEVDRLKLLESVITNTNDSVIITEAESGDHTSPRIIYVNDAFTKTTGYHVEEVIGKTPEILHGPLSDQKELKRLRNAMKNWKPCEITIVSYKKNGEPFWVNLSVSPVADDAGRHSHWISIERDVTVQKNTEDNLKKALLEKGEILESIGDGFFAVNRDWKVTYWNNQVATMLGVSKEKVLGNYLWDIFAHLIDSETYIKCHEAMSERILVTFKDYAVKLDRWLEMSIYPSNAGLSIYLKDISETIAYTKTIEEQNEKLKEIAYTQSHIVRAPLARILGITKLVSESDCLTKHNADLLNYLAISAAELDEVVKEIVRKTEDIQKT